VPALGTDSLASNASLDVLAEAKALADRFPSVGSAQLIEMRPLQARARSIVPISSHRQGQCARESLDRSGLRPDEDPGVSSCVSAAQRKWIAHPRTSP